MASDTTPTDSATEAPREPTSLWRHRDFMKLWIGFTTSAIGSNVTLVALPLIAVLVLGADEGELGILGMVGRAPLLLFLFAGFWADRFRKRPTMIWTDVGRGLIILLIPILWLTGDLNLVWLGAVSCVSVLMFAFFEVANMSHLPFLVGREHLGDGNAKLQLSQSIGKITGNSIGGALVGVFAAALVLLVDVVTFFISAIACALIRKPEPEPEPEDRPGVFASINTGLRWVWKEPLVRPGVIASGFYMFFFTAVEILLPLWILKGLGLEPYWVGILMAVGGPGAIIGALVAVRFLKRFGMGPSFFWATVAGNLSIFLIGAATGPTWLMILMVGAAQFILGVTGPIAGVNHYTLRQGVTPHRLQGRVMATQRFVATGVMPFGALAGGLAGEAFGMQPTLIICAIGALIPIAVLAMSPVPRTKFPPEMSDE